MQKPLTIRTKMQIPLANSIILWTRLIIDHHKFLAIIVDSDIRQPVAIGTENKRVFINIVTGYPKFTIQYDCALGIVRNNDAGQMATVTTGDKFYNFGGIRPSNRSQKRLLNFIR